jgi:hypothetical protein
MGGFIAVRAQEKLRRAVLRAPPGACRAGSWLPLVSETRPRPPAAPPAPENVTVKHKVCDEIAFARTQGS